MIHIEIENIPQEVSNISSFAIAKCDELLADLNSGVVKDVEAYIPESITLVDGAKAILTTAIAALQALKALADTDGLKGRLLTLSTQLTDLETAGKHEWYILVQWVQLVFNHIRKHS